MPLFQNKKEVSHITSKLGPCNQSEEDRISV